MQVAQPLSQLYQIHLAVREQELSTDLASQQYRGQRQSIAASVKQAYYATLQTESALEAAQALVKQYEETDRVATDYLAQESVLKSDSLEAKAKLAQSRYQIVQLRDTLQTQKEQLNELLARDLDTPFSTEQVPPITPAEMDLKTARKRRCSSGPKSRKRKLIPSAPITTASSPGPSTFPMSAQPSTTSTRSTPRFLPQNILSAGWN